MEPIRRSGSCRRRTRFSPAAPSWTLPSDQARADVTRRPYIDEPTTVVVVELPGNATAAGAADYLHPAS